MARSYLLGKPIDARRPSSLAIIPIFHFSLTVGIAKNMQGRLFPMNEAYISELSQIYLAHERYTRRHSSINSYFI